MAEKSFRQIEADIQTKGYKALCTEAVYEIQNLTRTLSYLEGVRADLKADIDKVCAYVMRGGIALGSLIEKL
jgi:hypothetical protein